MCKRARVRVRVRDGRQVRSRKKATATGGAAFYFFPVPDEYKRDLAMTDAMTGSCARPETASDVKTRGAFVSVFLCDASVDARRITHTRARARNVLSHRVIPERCFFRFFVHSSKPHADRSLALYGLGFFKFLGANSLPKREESQKNRHRETSQTTVRGSNSANIGRANSNGHTRSDASGHARAPRGVRAGAG